MRSFLRLFSMFLFSILVIPIIGLKAEQKGKPVIGRTDPTKYVVLHSHEGAGSIHFQELLGYSMGIFQSNFLWVHRCRIPPHSGIGLHLQRYMEDMFWVFNTPAEYTVNGHTSLLPAGSSVLCPMGSYHGIYNSSDSDTLEFINIAVSLNKYEANNSDADLGIIDLQDNLQNQRLESPASFAWANLDRSLLKSVRGLHGGNGIIFFRRLWDRESFQTPWASIDHLVLPPGTSVGYHQHTDTEEVYYIISGHGQMTVNDHSFEVRPDDAIPCTLGDSHGIYNSTNEDLEFFIMTIAMEKE